MPNLLHILSVLAFATPLGCASAQSTITSSPPLDTITILVGAGPGGGFDTNTRIFARHFGKHLPNKPNIVVQNLPGAGGMVVANTIFNSAPKDGSMLGVFAASVALEHLIGNSQARFDARKFEWIGSLEKDTQSCGVWNGAGQGITSFKQLITAKREVIFGSTSPQAATSQHALLLKGLFGVPAKVVYGYRGTADIKLALERGELSALCGLFISTIKSTFMREFQNGTLRILVQLGADGADPFFGDAVVLHGLAKDQETRDILDFILKQSQLARPMAAAPGTPRDRVSALRQGMLDTVKDTDLLADASRIGVEFNAVPGAELTAIFENYYLVPKERIKKVMSLLQ